MKENLKQQKGITLIALVITIIVLLILAGVSIAMLTGDNGILTQASNSKEATTQAQVEEMVSLAIGSLQTENLGDTSKITPQAIADQVNEENNRTDVTAEGSSFPTNIIFEKEGLKVPVYINLKVGSSIENEELPLYSVEVEESEIAPQDLFDIEPIEETSSNTKIAATTDVIASMPEARITGIKSEYCNSIQSSEQNTNYEIKYNGEIISDTLVIPYQVEIDGEMYKVTEVQLKAYGKDLNEGYSMPKVSTIIYPNTVERIYGKNAGGDYTEELKRVVLSKNLKEIGDYAFYGCSGLESITIPEGVTSIGSGAFGYCENLDEITIPSTVTSIGNNAFSSYANDAKIINIKKPEGSITVESWGKYNVVTVNWNYQGE